jgi:hypothetical protein
LALLIISFIALCGENAKMANLVYTKYTSYKKRGNPQSGGAININLHAGMNSPQFTYFPESGRKLKKVSSLIYA